MQNKLYRKIKKNPAFYGLHKSCSVSQGREYTNTQLGMCEFIKPKKARYLAQYNTL